MKSTKQMNGSFRETSLVRVFRCTSAEPSVHNRHGAAGRAETKESPKKNQRNEVEIKIMVPSRALTRGGVGGVYQLLNFRDEGQHGIQLKGSR